MNDLLGSMIENPRTLKPNNSKNPNSSDETPYILTTTSLSEPNSYDEAMKSPDKDQWYQACLAEVRELERQHTYDIIDISKMTKQDINV